MNKAQLVEAAKLQWTRTEAAVGKAARGNFATKPADGDWSSADIFRHLVDTARKLPAGLDELVRHGELRTLQPGDREGIEALAHIDAKALPGELHTVHGTLWLALQKLSEKDLARDITIFGGTRKLGDLAQALIIVHEQQHVEQALKAAGVA